MKEDKVETEIIKIPAPEPEKIRPFNSANSLFHFVTEIEYLEEIISKKTFFPRYCTENIAYLNVELNGKIMSNVAYPEKCFCDIPLHGILLHKGTYGAYGIGMAKAWGEANGLQPIQYINPSSPLAEDFREAFLASILADDSKYLDTVSSYLHTHMFFIKPIKGENRNRVSGETETKYFTDECEWRYIPKLSDRLPFVLTDHVISEKNGRGKPIIDVYNETLKTKDYSDVWLRFEYDDIKYIIVEDSDQRDILISFISKLKLAKQEKLRLISKFIILNDALEDY